MKVCIAGLSQSSRHLIPWNREGWEIWGLAWDSQRYDLHRAFEIHDMPMIRTIWPSPDAYLDKISSCNRLYMADSYLPGSIKYPLDEVIADVGDYFCSSIAYMLALAIHEKAEEILLCGVDMRADEEYGHQRPNCEYLIGLARGRGIKVTIPEQSPLCKYSNPALYEHDGRYGKSK